MELKKEELKIVIEALLFTSTSDACLDSEKFDSQLAVDLATRLNDDTIELACYLYKGHDEYYEDELSKKIENSIKQIRVRK